MVVLDRLRALVVDDNAYARAVTAASLRKLGLSMIEEADGGAEAIGALLGGGFDVMFMDWYMPEISGAGLLQVVRDKRFGPMSGIPVVLMTAYPTRENIARARALGVNEIITKPFTAAQVAAVLTRVLPDAWALPEEQPRATADKFFL